MMRFGMPLLLECASIQEGANLCERLGLSFIELNMNLPSCTPEKLNAPLYRRLSRDMGIGFSLHMDERIDPFDFNLHTRRAAFETSLAALTAARAAEMPTITMHLSEGVFFTLPNERVYLYEKFRDDYLFSVRSFRNAIHQEARGEVLVCVENTGGYRPFQLEALDLLLEYDSFALCRDVGHEHAAGYADTAFFDAHADRIVHMHLHDAQGRTNHLPLGEGEVDIAAQLDFARAHGISCVIEVKTSGALERSVLLLQGKG